MTERCGVWEGTMALGRDRFGTVVVAVGVILLLVGVFTVPVAAQTDQYEDN